MFKGRSKTAFISAVLGAAYSIYSLIYWFGVAGTAADTSDAAEAIGAGIATALILPHVLIAVLATVFTLIGFFVRGKGLILTGAILFSASALFFLLYAAFVLPSIVLGFVGYANQKKLNKARSQESDES